MDEDNYITCVPWGCHGIPSVKRFCICGAEVALSNGNVAKADSMNMKAICSSCSLKLLRENKQSTFGGGLVDGTFYPTLAQGLLAALAVKNRN